MDATKGKGVARDSTLDYNAGGGGGGEFLIKVLKSW